MRINFKLFIILQMILSFWLSIFFVRKLKLFSNSAYTLSMAASNISLFLKYTISESLLFILYAFTSKLPFYYTLSHFLDCQFLHYHFFILNFRGNVEYLTFIYCITTVVVLLHHLLFIVLVLYIAFLNQILFFYLIWFGVVTAHIYLLFVYSKRICTFLVIIFFFYFFLQKREVLS